MQLTMVTMVTAAAVCWLADDDDDILEQHLGYIFDVTFVSGTKIFNS
jgi:hypothetical protein